MSATPNEAAFNAEVTSSLPNISDTNSGILVGTDPKPQPVTLTTNTTEITAPKTGARFTDEDIARARQQEKDKLYPQLEEMKSTLAEWKKERDERLAQEEAARREAEEQARAKQEAETDLRTLLTQKEQEWEARLEAERKQREEAFQTLEFERQYQQLVEYKNSRLAQEQDNIVPQLRSLVTGNTPDEIEASINSLKEMSAGILEDIRSASQANRQNMVGARVTAPSVGPMDTNSDQQKFSPQSIADMSFNEYVANRSRLIGQSATNRGMFG